MFWKKSQPVEGVNWNTLTSEDQIQELIEESKEKPVLIYKHSTRCGISSMVLDRLERTWTSEDNPIKPYILDLISFRNVSNAVAQSFEVYHESPQVILIKDGKAVYDASHMQVSFDALKHQAR
ncbi:bacillithiol system redox-active protein YtxJ [Roseivirga sp. E12]|uniref:bacillithiol system redox-active protein YtxJ n=1 Tax=Roseivirga sp. E12 TaxID=2819237 RepID=UPI001ABCD166|nr:bacillithiol system redox-active protein YtxJ [Roseivirga sp. E12]MBO3699210.1 bacillithiol system redox-active protein YtxJ [Roseivirga sp. E12]